MKRILAKNECLQVCVSSSSLSFILQLSPSLSLLVTQGYSLSLHLLFLLLLSSLTDCSVDYIQETVVKLCCVDVNVFIVAFFS